ncbi:MAG: anaerobic sulfatase-maturation protein [Terriglobales bacterium]
MSGFQIMAKPNGSVCNLNCEYCYYLEKENLYPNTSSFKMSDEVLEHFVRQYIRSQQAPVVSFVWQGGEPTLRGLEFYKKVVALQTQYAGGKKIENAFQTNGLLLNDRWAEFLKRNNFLVGLSIDGPAELHDAHRVDKGGAATFQRVMRGLGFLQKHGVEFNTLTVVNRKNSYFPLEVYRFLKEIGSKYLQFIPIVEQVAQEPTPHGLVLLKPASPERSEVSEWSVEPLQYGRFLQAVFDEWVRRDVGRTFVQIFDVALEAWVGIEPSLCVFAKNCGDAMVLEHNGDVYSCDHFVYPDDRLGNLLHDDLKTMATSEQQKQFGEAKSSTLPRKCLQCNVRFACNGECPKHRFTRTETGEPGLNYLCDAYKLFFQHVDPYMRYMAGRLQQGKAPADIMNHLRDCGGQIAGYARI